MGRSKKRVGAEELPDFCPLKGLFSVRAEDRPRAWQVAEDFQRTMNWDNKSQVVDVILRKGTSK